MLVQEQKEAILLRKKGCSYGEILQKIPVAKSTLSLWLRGVGLSKRQIQRITAKKIEAGKRGAAAQKEKRRLVTREINEKARVEIDKARIDRTHLWLMGTMLYWAEGAKERPGSPSTGVKFSNSDPLMLKLTKKWLVEVCKIPLNHIRYDLYIHENNRHRLTVVKEHWARVLEIEKVHGVYFKKHVVKTKRKNAGESYFGLIIMTVKKSTNLNRKITGWIEGVSEKCWGIV
jgi:hypothetical protein